MAKQATSKKQPKLDQGNVDELGADVPIMIGSAEASGTERPDASNTDEWPIFDPSFLLPSTSPAPRFPVEALPVNLRSLVVDFAEARLLSVDYIAGAILTACSGAIGNRARLRNFDGDAEPLAVFTGLIGLPSVGKSLGISVVERPILAIDQEMQKAHGLMLKGADHKLLEKFDRKLRETVARRLMLEDIPLEHETSDGDGVVAAPGIILS